MDRAIGSSKNQLTLIEPEGASWVEERPSVEAQEVNLFPYVQYDQSSIGAGASQQGTVRRELECCDVARVDARKLPQPLEWRFGRHLGPLKRVACAL